VRARRGRALLPLGLGAVVGGAAVFAGVWATGAFDDEIDPGTAEERLATPVATVFVGRSAEDGIDGVAEALVELRAGDDVGSGVVLRDDGHVLTTADLVGDRRTVRVWSVDGTERAGQVVGLDPATDVAVIRVEGLAARGALLGGTDGLAVGDPTRAVTLGDEGAALVLSGVVANLAVTVSRDEQTPLHGLIGTDIVTSDPVEGAALVDADGVVVGLTTGVGDTEVLRAVPIDLARIVAHDIIATGAPEHPWLGIEGRDLDEDLAAEWGVPGGAELAAVVEDSPADAAGLEAEDVITHVGRLAITSMGDLVTALRHHDPGDGIRVGYLRDGLPHWGVAMLAEPAP
jgi:S1-C subfamily serine protease